MTQWKNKALASYAASEALALVGLLGLIALLHAQSLNYPLLFDDSVVINSNISNVLQDINSSGQLRRIVFGLSLYLTHLFAGLEHIWMYRVGNIAIHMANTLLIYSFLTLLLNQEKITLTPEKKKLASWAGAAFFGLHPAGIYAVTYLAQRSTALATFFSLIMLLCFCIGVRNEKLHWCIFGVVGYAFAVLSKEHAITLPLIVLLIPLLMGKPFVTCWPLLRMPLALLTAIGIATYFIIAQPYHGIAIGKNIEPFSMAFLETIPDIENRRYIYDHLFLLSIINQTYLFFKYLFFWLISFPGWMSADLRQPFPNSLFAWPQIIGPVLFIGYAATTHALLRQGGLRGMAGFGLLAPLLAFLTEVATVRFQEPFVLYRSYYWMATLPTIVPLIALILPKRATIPILATLVVVLMWSSDNRIRTFSSPYDLARDMVEKNADESLPGAHRGLIDLAISLTNQKQYDLALAYFERAYGTVNDKGWYFHFKGDILLQAKRPEDALASFKIAMRHNPGNSDFHLSASKALLELNKPQEALEELEKYIGEIPNNSIAFLSRATAHEKLGHHDAALTDLDRAIALNSRNDAAMHDRAAWYLRGGRLQEAMADANRAINLEQGKAAYFITRSTVHVTLGEWVAALEDQDKAINLEKSDQNLAPMLFSRGLIQVKLNKTHLALEDLRKSCKMGHTLACQVEINVRAKYP